RMRKAERNAHRPVAGTLPREGRGINDLRIAKPRPPPRAATAGEMTPAVAARQRPGKHVARSYRPSVARSSFGCIIMAATQHEIAVARVMAHMEIHISDLLCLASSPMRPAALSSAPDIGKIQKDAFWYSGTERAKDGPSCGRSDDLITSGPCLPRPPSVTVCAGGAPTAGNRSLGSPAMRRFPSAT